jgi:hypothetical protein
LTEIVASALLLIGLGFTLVGSIGLVRLPDFYTRMHAPGPEIQLDELPPAPVERAGDGPAAR